jgi:OHCU decarboxylase
MMIVMIITAVETTGDVFATGEIVDKKIGNEDISRALRADGVATTLGGVLNSFPYTCFTENVGLVRLTQIKSRWVVVSAGVIMIILGSLPKAAAIVAGIPHPVLGGAALVMFATVAVVGLQTLAKVDFNDYNIFQGPTWPVEKAFGQRPFADAPDLRAAFQEALLGGTAEEQRELMTAYPNLGVDRELTAESATDQSWVGLAYLGEEEEQEFAELSKIYHEKFGIPFIVCLRDLEKRDQILRLGWRRLENSFGQEHVAALNEVSRIAGYRFEDLVAGANPISSARTQRFEQLR